MQPGQAWGHAALLESVPADGTRLDVPPTEVRLRFDEAVTPIALTLVGPEGPVPLPGAPAWTGDLVSARLPPGLTRGTWLLSFRVTSADSHPVAGTIAFGVGEAPASRPVAGERWWAPSVVVRAVFLAALLVAAGGAMFRLVAEPPWRGALAFAAWAGVGLAFVQLGLRGALLADAPRLLAGDVWRLGAGTTLAVSLAVSAAGLAGCALTAGTGWRRVGAGFGLLAVAGLPLSGHAATADPRWLMGPALLLHGAGAAIWIGALIPLLGLLRGDAAAALHRFSAIAVPAVAALLASGTMLAVVQLGSFAALWGSVYGTVLLLKGAAVGGLVGLAALNKLLLTPRLQAGGGALRTSIRGELALAGAVLAATAVLGLTPPPRAAPAPTALGGREWAGRERAVWTVADGVPATIAVRQTGPGRRSVTVVIGRATPPREVTLELANPAAGVAALRRTMRPSADGWLWEGVELALPGRWTVTAHALLTEFDQASFTAEIDIP